MCAGQQAVSLIIFFPRCCSRRLIRFEKKNRQKPLERDQLLVVTASTMKNGSSVRRLTIVDDELRICCGFNQVKPVLKRMLHKKVIPQTLRNFRSVYSVSPKEYGVRAVSVSSERALKERHCDTAAEGMASDSKI